MERKLNEVLSVLMDLEKNFSVLYENISQIDGNYDPSIKRIAKILAGVELKHYENYKKLIDELTAEEDIDISEELFDKSRKLLRDFKSSMGFKSLRGSGDLLIMAEKYENHNAEMLEKIVEFLESAKEKNNDRILKMLEELIENEKGHAKSLRSFIK